MWVPAALRPVAASTHVGGLPVQPRHSDQLRPPEGAKRGGIRFRRGLLAGALALVTLVGTGAATGMASAAPAAGGTAVAAQITTKKTASAPDFGENVDDLRRAPGPLPRSRRSSMRSTPSRSATRWVAIATASTSCRAHTAPTRSPCKIKVGYYTEVAGLGASPGDVQINGKIEVNNRCFDDGQPGVHRLLRAEQLLARHVQPDHQRQGSRPGRLLSDQPTSGPSRRRSRCAEWTSRAAT